MEDESLHEAAVTMLGTELEEQPGTAPMGPEAVHGGKRGGEAQAPVLGLGGMSSMGLPSTQRGLSCLLVEGHHHRSSTGDSGLETAGSVLGLFLPAFVHLCGFESVTYIGGAPETLGPPTLYNNDHPQGKGGGTMRNEPARQEVGVE